MNKAQRPTFEDELRLAALLTAVSCSRMFVHHDLERWGIARGHIERAEFLTSELVAMAVNATGITVPHPRYSDAYGNLKLIGVRLRLFARSLVIEVWDSSKEPPDTQTSESWRGLFLVQALSQQSSYYFPRSGGKVVWCELDISTPPSDDTMKLPPVLPRRQRKVSPGQPAEIMNDPDMLRRVLDGLRALRTENEQEQ